MKIGNIVLPKLREDAHERKRLEKEYPWKE